MAVGVVAGDDDVGELGGAARRLRESGIELRRDDREPGAAVGEHEAVIVRGQKRVDRHGDDAGLDGAEKGGGPVDRVVEAEQDALLAADAERTQHVTETFDALGKLPVSAAAAVVDIGELAGAAGVEIAFENVGGEVVVARHAVSGRARPQARLSDGHCRVVLPVPQAFAGGGGLAAHDPPTGAHYADLKIARQRPCHGRQIAL